MRPIQEAAGTWFLHHLSTCVATHVTESIIAEYNGAVLYPCIGYDEFTICQDIAEALKLYSTMFNQILFSGKSEMKSEHCLLPNKLTFGIVDKHYTNPYDPFQIMFLTTLMSFKQNINFPNTFRMIILGHKDS